MKNKLSRVGGPYVLWMTLVVIVPIVLVVVYGFSASGETAGEIGAHFDMTAATVSHHLSVLKAAGLVSDERRGKWIYYEMNLSVLDEITGWLAGLKGETDHEK